MTSREKAQQIYGRMTLAVSTWDGATPAIRAKGCTLVCIHQVIMALTTASTSTEKLVFWQAVEKEVGRL